MSSEGSAESAVEERQRPHVEIGAVKLVVVDLLDVLELSEVGEESALAGDFQRAKNPHLDLVIAAATLVEVRVALSDAVKVAELWATTRSA